MFHSITDKNAEIGTGNKTEDCLIQQFVHTFEESIPTWPSSINDDAMLELRPAMDALVRDIDTDFTILKEVEHKNKPVTFIAASLSIEDWAIGRFNGISLFLTRRITSSLDIVKL